VLGRRLVDQKLEKAWARLRGPFSAHRFKDIQG
jgi:hypothetical protein